MGVRARQFGGRPCDWPGCAASADPSVSFAHGSPVSSNSTKGVPVRAIGLDVHRDFCEVAIAEEGKLRSAGRIATRPEVLEAFAASLTSDERVVMEVTGNAWEIARIIEPHVKRVIVVSPSDTGIRQARAKTDRLDARTLAKLLAAGSLESVWMPDERTRVMRRRLSRRSQLVDARTRVKNEVHAILFRRLKGRPDVSDLFGKQGRAWLAELELPVEERETLDSGLRQIDFLDAEVALVERAIAHDALNWPDARRLMTVPGVNLVVAVTFLATVGDIHRFPDRRKLVAYLGLAPKVRQSGDAPASHGHISKQGSSSARHALVEASWSAVRTSGPLHAFYSRIRVRRGHQVAICAAARKLACVFWAMLWREQDYAFGQPSMTAKKIRRLEITAGAPRRQDSRGVWAAARAMRDAERDLARQAEQAYAQTIRDRQAAGAVKAGASATSGHASQTPSKGKAARQTTSP